ncbi:2030_t:CDS:1 [Acaulospora morrowiae]|uniref:2030_t:CDS:1 n=1 Tax=Acaulospora morrowiae TaxID=94023 RepID=A0A9N9AN59_9GLOM|nr:2030_t:CDS:1 [Acaulospora morrowiae]
MSKFNIFCNLSSNYLQKFNFAIPVPTRKLRFHSSIILGARFIPVLRVPFNPIIKRTFYPSVTRLNAQAPNCVSTPKRAVAYFGLPDTAAATGAILFWETGTGVTIIHGQFSGGFQDEIVDYVRIRIYRENKVLFDLKPLDGSLRNIFRIRENGSTDSFLFVVPKRLISEEPWIVGSYVVIDSLRSNRFIAKDLIVAMND